MKYSVIIPSYNSAATIMPCLEAVTQQRFDEPYEIIVIDSSSDATPEIIRQHFPQIQLIHLTQQIYPGTARNIGIDRSQGDIICFIDSDCIAAPDWLSKIAEAHKGDYAAVGGSIANGNPESLIGWAGYFAELREFFPFHPRQLMLHVPSGNITYKRRVFEQYGNFQNLYPDGFAQKHPQQEDLIFNMNLSRNRERILFDPEIQVSHINPTSIKHFVLQLYKRGRSTSFLLKHFPDLKGHIITRSRILTLLATPLLPCIKYLNTFRIAMLSIQYFRAFIFASPILFIGLFFWGAGFARGAFLPRTLV